jgi:hypothetical protein
MSAKAAMRERIAASMRTGGFADAVKAQGAPLERVRRYVESFTREEPAPASAAVPPTTRAFRAFATSRSR